MSAAATVFACADNAVDEKVCDFRQQSLTLSNAKVSARQQCLYCMKVPNEEICGKSTQGT